jgi:hypothetical protein
MIVRNSDVPKTQDELYIEQKQELKQAKKDQLKSKRMSQLQDIQNQIQ